MCPLAKERKLQCSKEPGTTLLPSSVFTFYLALFINLSILRSEDVTESLLLCPKTRQKKKNKNLNDGLVYLLANVGLFLVEYYAYIK